MRPLRLSRAGRSIGVASILLLSAASTAHATTYNVGTTADPAGACATPPTGCSLRQALALVNASPSAPDVINLPAGDYANSQGAQFTIGKAVAIAGAGSKTSIVRGSAGSRVFEVNASSATSAVSMSGITITGGHANADLGGGIHLVNGTLSLSGVAIVSNTADAGGGIYGGFTAGQPLTMADSLIANNTATGTDGAGGLQAGYAQSHGTLRNVTVTGNTAMGSGTSAAGGIDGAGGGGAFGVGTGLSLVGSTIAGNTAAAVGGAGNLAGSFLLQGTIVAGGTGPAGHENCVAKTGPADISQGYNLEDQDQCLPAKSTGDLVNTNPMLGTLALTPDATSTLALLPGSPAINTGNPGACNDAGLAHDQRQLPRPQGAACDIGAFEFQLPAITGVPTISGTHAVGSTLSCAAPAAASLDGPITSTGLAWLRDGSPVATGGGYLVQAADAAHTLTCQFAATNAAGTAAASSAGSAIPAPTAGGGAGGGAGGTNAAKHRAPKLTLTAVKRSLGTIEKSKGFLVSVRCDIACSVKAGVRIGKLSVGSGKRSINGKKAALVRVHLTKTGLKRIKHRKSVKFRVTITATSSGKKTVKTLTVSAKRG